MNLHYSWSQFNSVCVFGGWTYRAEAFVFPPPPAKANLRLAWQFSRPLLIWRRSNPVQSKSTQFKRHSPCWMDLVVAPFFVACFILLLCSTFHKLVAPPDELCVCYDVTQGMAQGSLWRAVEVRWGKVEKFKTVRASVWLFRDTDVWFWKCNNVLVYILGLFSRLTSKTCAIY